MQAGRVPGPLAIVIFGGTGDLARHMLIPALYCLYREHLLPDSFALVGCAAQGLSNEEYREFLRKAVVGDNDEHGAWAGFAEKIFYESGRFEDPGTFQRLKEGLARADRENGCEGNHLFYLAVPPGVIATIAKQLGAVGLANRDETPWTRIVVEKPFGRDLDSARALNTLLLTEFDESQIYRIDHYLGKETVQNLLIFRFANVIWEAVWNRRYVDHVEITVAEDVGVGTRAGYYETAGALRDMVQSHLFQLLTLVAMEPPASYDADSIRSEKVKVLHSVRRIDVANDLVRGQYGPGLIGAREVVGYRDEANIAPDSPVETYVALRLWLDNWRWADVPFFLRTGKRLARKATELAIQFRPAPHPILDIVEGDTPVPNVLLLRIQPEEGISLRFEAKVPGLAGPIHEVSMDFSYKEAFKARSPAAYERLLLDAMLGDATLFARNDEVEAAWSIVSPVLSALSTSAAPPLEVYPAGGWGPPGADALLGKDGRRWRVPEPAVLTKS